MSKSFRLDFTVFVAALTVYGLTLAPGVLPADAGEFQVVAARLGLAHPPGYPLYTLLARGFILLIPHDPARAVNLFSAVTAALTVMLAGRVTRRLSHMPLAGFAAALTLMVTSSFWVTAGQASIRPMTAFFVALALDRLVAYHRTRREQALFGFALALGLGVTHHPSVVFPGAFLGLYLLLIEPRLRRREGVRGWAILIGGVALGFLPWLYLPLRGPEAFLAPAGIRTWPGFWDHVLARGFSGDLFAFTSLSDLLDRALVWANIMRWQFNPLLLVLMSVGALLAFFKEWRIALTLSGGALLHSAITMTYRAPQTVEYLIPAYVLLIILMMVGLASLRDYKELYGRLALGVTILAALALGWRSAPSLAVLATDESSERFAQTLLQEAPQQAVILAPWHHATPLWAVQHNTGLRPDVEVVYVFPEGAQPLAETWLERIDDYSTERPVLLTGFYPATFTPADYTYTPLDMPYFPAWLVETSALADLPEGFAPRDILLGDSLRLIGIDAPESIAPGRQMAVRVAWRVETPLTAPVTGFLHLTTPEGVVITAADVALNQAQPGDIILTRHIVGLPPENDLPELGLIAGAYLSTDGTLLLTSEGQPRAGIGSVTRIGETYQPQGTPFDGMSLTAVQVPDTLQAGQEIIVDLTFYAERPLFTDRIIKVDLIAADGTRLAQSDRVPALGAVPTLKWLEGWRIHDRHRLQVPADANLNGASLQLAVYDHFTNAAYPVLDSTLNQQGATMTIYQWP